MLTITTCRSYPEAPETLAGLISALHRRGVATCIDIWQNEPLTTFLLPLCAWDYALEPQRFEHWLDKAVQAGSRFINSPQLMRWNMNKRYLCRLAEQGADVIPTETAAAQTGAVRRIMETHAWHEAVLKPAIGQSGRHVVRVRYDETMPDWANYPYGVVVQPFISDIESAGETALVFFNGSFSHAVRRQPPSGEWRANSAYGVSVSAVVPSEYAVRTAEKVLARLPEMPVYARVDGTLLAEGRFLLNELELIEPALYLHTDKNAPSRFADILASMCTV